MLILLCYVLLLFLQLGQPPTTRRILPLVDRLLLEAGKKNDAVLLRFTGKTGHKERVFDSFEVFQIDSCVLISGSSL